MRFRRDRLTQRLFDWSRTALPSLSETKAEASASGDFQAELFTDKPDQSRLRAVPAFRLRGEKETFLDGPCPPLI